MRSTVNLIHDLNQETRATPDGELLRRASQGDETAFRVLYERHRAALFRFAYRLLGSTQAAEDTVQDCFLELLKRPHNFDNSRAALRTYLYAMTRHHAFKRLRRGGVETSLEDFDETNAVRESQFAASSANPLEQMLSDELAASVKRAIEMLPPLQREALILFEYEELSLAEIAAIVQTEIGTVKARLHRARSNMRGLLNGYLRETTEHAEAVS